MSFAAPTHMPTNNAEMAMYGDDRKLIVTFSKEPVHMTFKSEMEGKPVYEDHDFITIITPGGKSDVKRPVKSVSDERGPSDNERFPRQWAAYQNQQAEVHDGQPLEMWAPLGKAHVMTLKAARIYTVEQLSQLPDTALQNIPIMDARKYRDMAIKYLEMAANGAPISKLTRENQDLREQMAVMQDQIAALAANQKKKPGRPPGGHSEEE